MSAHLARTSREEIPMGFRLTGPDLVRSLSAQRCYIVDRRRQQTNGANAMTDRQITTATYIDTDSADGEQRHWYTVNGLYEADVDEPVDFAITSENQVLDGDGAPLTESDALTIAVRRAIIGNTEPTP